MIASASRNNTLIENEVDSSVVSSLSEALLDTFQFAVNCIGNSASDLVEPLLLSSEVESFLSNFSEDIDLFDEVLSE